ncbi:hypothetical protein GLE_5519 [Lysobacter enzymogenes]|uniref:Uncharacterized protein n=1 Tax=Lysobacter enzymogenes TaxID=69 RepID=A0A0S2DQX0_LYSEN|nr:hypothetical protein [Lysobacter enzymogenes]ALN60860.1 hypothetical protein GLE_5519 [Lysobacter enzymogenes]QCW24420.1 hypothetical protein FE772_00790 [Lysobacter enzymogenes]
MKQNDVFKECLTQLPESVLADFGPLTGGVLSTLAQQELQRRAALALQSIPGDYVVDLLLGRAYPSKTVADVLAE